MQEQWPAQKVSCCAISTDIFTFTKDCMHVNGTYLYHDVSHDTLLETWNRWGIFRPEICMERPTKWQIDAKKKGSSF